MPAEKQAESPSLAKIAISNVLLVVNGLVWYLCFFSFLRNTTNCTGGNLVILIGVNLLTVILFAVLSSALIQKIKNRLKFLIYWMIVGALLSPIILLIGNISFFSDLVVSIVGGTYFGFGFPVLMGYYSATVGNENRAKISGITVFFIFLSFTLLALFVQDELFTAITLTLWKLGGLAALLFLKPSEAAISDEEQISYMDVIKTRSVWLYFIPWLIFSTVNNFAFPVLHATFESDFIFLMTLAEGVLSGIFAVFFGFLADRFGRKRLLITGFTLLGLGYAILGLFPAYARGLLFYTIVDGVAWGIFATLFLLTLWGDIAGKKGSEKFFVIGFMPYLLSSFLRLIFDQYVANNAVNLIVVFSFACFFLFITFIPLYIAPEVMVKKDPKDDLRRYLKTVNPMVEESKNSKKQ